MTESLCSLRAKFSLLHDQFINKSMNLFSLSEIQSLSDKQQEMKQMVDDLFSGRPSDRMDELLNRIKERIASQENERSKEIEALLNNIKSKLQQLHALSPDLNETQALNQKLQTLEKDIDEKPETEGLTESEECIERALGVQRLNDIL